MNTPRKSPVARLSAVIALAAGFLALILIVTASLGGGGSDGGKSSKPASSKPRVVNGTKLGKFWTVRPDQSLSVIAARTGVSVARLQSLNPSVDPQALHEGERIRIKAKPSQGSAGLP